MQNLAKLAGPASFLIASWGPSMLEIGDNHWRRHLDLGLEAQHHVEKQVEDQLRREKTSLKVELLKEKLARVRATPAPAPAPAPVPVPATGSKEPKSPK